MKALPAGTVLRTSPANGVSVTVLSPGRRADPPSDAQERSMTKRIYNFSAGPAVLPESVLEEAKENLLSLGGTGIGIMEHSHRGKAFLGVYQETEDLCRQLANIPDSYRVLFLQGGASLQFSMVPMNFLAKDQTADYLMTGIWSEKAKEEALRYGNVREACSSKEANYNYVPRDCQFGEAPRYIHFTSNNTIFGTEFHHDVEGPFGVPVICDASSNIFSKPIDVTKYGLIYAGAQKNLGPSGVTLVIVRNELVEEGSKDLPTMLQYRTHAKNESMYNTPPTFGIYVMNLVFKWIMKEGGLAAMAQRNQAKAGELYMYLDQSELFQATALDGSRSLMNVTFVTGNESIDARFIAAATKAGFDGLKGHRSVGGMRASIYNAFPPEGVTALVDFMREFEKKELASA